MFNVCWLHAVKDHMTHGDLQRISTTTARRLAISSRTFVKIGCTAYTWRGKWILVLELRPLVQRRKSQIRHLPHGKLQDLTNLISFEQPRCYGLLRKRTTTKMINMGNRQPAPQCQFNSREPLRMSNVVLGETSGNYIPLHHGLQAWKYLMTNNPLV